MSTKEKKEAAAVQPANSQQVQTVNKNILPASERFTQMVLKEFTTTAGEVAITDFQRRLIQNYFVIIDLTLKTAEQKRMAKSENYREALPYTWDNVNMNTLALRVVAFARIGLDPAQPNHINLIPFKNNQANQYEITAIVGYRGIELKATKYGLNIPDAVTVELIYSNDKFEVIKKDVDHPADSYKFTIKDPFDRGQPVGGFYFLQFRDTPEKNRLVVWNLQQIEKRKPKHASAEFWGGTKDVWKNNKKEGTEKVEGWYEEMLWKTLDRAAWNSITIDSQKIDDDYMKLLEAEQDANTIEGQSIIQEKANRKELAFEEDQTTQDAQVIESKPLVEVKQEPLPETKEEPLAASESGTLFNQEEAPKQKTDRGF